MLEDVCMSTTAPQVALAIRNILVATDFSPCSERALLHAVAAAHHFGSTLHLAHVVQPATFAFVPPEGYLGTAVAIAQAVDLARTEAADLLDQVLRTANCLDLNRRTWVNAGAVGETLRVIMAREHIDFVVVGTHAKTGLLKLVLGSVAEDIFRNAPCPVLTVGPHSWQSDPRSVRLKHILFPTDFSADSARALPLARAVAADFGAAITLLHVVEHPDSEAARDPARLVSALQGRMRDMVASAGPMPPDARFEVTIGDVAEEVIATAKSLSVDLIAFGLKAPDTYVDRLPWMHAYKVVCEVGCPVLSLRGPSALHT